MEHKEYLRWSMAMHSRQRNCGDRRRAIGLFCWLYFFSVVPFVLFVPNGVKQASSTKPRLSAQAEDKESDASAAELERLKAELELAQARAAAAEAKAALAAAKAAPEGTPSEQVAGGLDVALEPEVVGAPGASMDFSAYSETELRPAKLLYGAEGAPLFEVLEKMEDVKELGSTSLDAVLRAWFMSLYQFSAASQAGDLPPDAPEDFRRNVKEVGAALKPEEIASFLMDRDKGGDWRPCVRGLAQTEFAKIMDDSLSWNVIFSDQVVAASNVTMPEGRSRVVNFLASESFKQAGSWSDSEADAAERLIEKDPRLQRVFSRMNSVKNSIGENIRSASLAPILAIVFFVAALCFFCNGLSLSSPQQDFTPGFQQDLPLMGLEKGK